MLSNEIKNLKDKIADLELQLEEYQVVKDVMGADLEVITRDGSPAIMYKQAKFKEKFGIYSKEYVQALEKKVKDVEWENGNHQEKQS